MQRAFTDAHMQNLFGNTPGNDGGAKDVYFGNSANPDKCQEYIQMVNTFLTKPDVQRVIEVGCGDMRLSSQLDLSKVDSYTCIDVVPQVVEHAKATHKLPNAHFVSGDASTMKMRGDLLIVKDVFHYWPNEDLVRFTRNNVPNFRYSILTHDPREPPRSAVGRPLSQKPVPALRPYNAPRVPGTYEGINFEDLHLPHGLSASTLLQNVCGENKVSMLAENGIGDEKNSSVTQALAVQQSMNIRSVAASVGSPGILATFLAGPSNTFTGRPCIVCDSNVWRGSGTQAERVVWTRCQYNAFL